MIRLCTVTSVERLSKAFSLNKDGSLKKEPGGSLYRGDARNISVVDLRDLARVLGTLNQKQALTFGIHKGANNPVPLTTKEKLEQRPGHIARSRDYFEYCVGQTGILLLDYDPAPGAEPLSATAYWDTIKKAVTGLEGREHLIISSASSHIYKSDEACLIGAGGLHCFVTVQNAADIPAIGEAIDARLWLAGLGRMEETKDGKKVKRNLVDTCVWKPEHYSFDAGAACAAGLEQRRPEPVYGSGDPLSLAEVELSDDEARQFHLLSGRVPHVTRGSGAKRGSGAQRGFGVKETPSQAGRDDAVKALAHISADCAYDDWLKVGMALSTLDGGFAIWDAWSSKGEKYPGRTELEAKWQSFAGAGISLGTLFHLATLHGYRREGRFFTDALCVPDDADSLFIVIGEAVAKVANAAGFPAVGLGGAWDWSAGENKPTEAFGALVATILAEKPQIKIVATLFPPDGTPRPWSKGDDGEGVKVPMPGRWISENASITHAAYRMVEAVRKLPGLRCVTTARFLPLEGTFGVPGFETFMENALKPVRKAAGLLKDPIFCGEYLDPDALGQKGAPSAEMAFCEALDGKNVGGADRLLYEWAGSHWSLIPQDRLEKGAHKLIAAFFAASGDSRKISGATRAALSAPNVYEMPEPIGWTEAGGALIPCADVTLDVAADGAIRLREPRKEDGLRYCVNARWADKDKPSPEFDRFIQGTLPDPAVRRLVQQYVGYTLISDNRFQVAQWWFGSGANGKGFLAQIVSALHRKVAAADIEDLGGFGAENLIDASLITVDETPKRIDEQRLKSAISGDDLNINRKYQVPVTVRLRAKWLLRGNDKPALSDQTDGLWRRLQIIEFTQKFEGDRRDDMLADRIVEHELPGVLRWAVDGLVMLLKAGGFKDIPGSVQASKKQMQVETDNVLGWWTENEVQVCDAPRTIKDSVYRNYSLWCDDNGMKPLGSPRFWTRVGAIVSQGGGVVITSKAREKITNPIDGTTRTDRTRKVNLDLDAADGDTEKSAVVIPMPANQVRPEHKLFADVMTGTPLDLADDDGFDDDLSDIPF